jgi:creatinine amidohydrolase
LAREYARLASEAEPAVVFPAMYFGEKSGAGEWKGTIIFPETLIHEILLQSCKEIARNGFKKIVIFNAHGGNISMLQNFARSILQKRYDFMVFVYGVGASFKKDVLPCIEKYPYLTDDDVEEIKGVVGSVGGHGCFDETSLVYAVCPEHVRLDKFGTIDGSNTHLFDDFSKNGVYTPFGWMGNYPNSLTANYFGKINDRIAMAIRDAALEKATSVLKFLKEETVSDEYHKAWLEKNKNLPLG